MICQMDKRKEATISKFDEYPLKSVIFFHFICCCCCCCCLMYQLPFEGFLTGSSNHYTHRRCFEGFCGLDLWNNTEPDLQYKGKKSYSTYLFAKKSAKIVKNHNPKKVRKYIYIYVCTYKH